MVMVGISGTINCLSLGTRDTRDQSLLTASETWETYLGPHACKDSWAHCRQHVFLPSSMGRHPLSWTRAVSGTSFKDVLASPETNVEKATRSWNKYWLSTGYWGKRPTRVLSSCMSNAGGLVKTCGDLRQPLGGSQPQTAISSCPNEQTLRHFLSETLLPERQSFLEYVWVCLF